MQKFPQGKWILKVNQNSDAIFSCLSEKTHLIDKNREQHKEFNRGENEGKVLARKREVNLDEEEEVKGEKKEKEDEGLLIEASKQLNKGLKFAGGMMSKGLSSFGGFIASKVSKKEETEISE